MIKFFQKLKAKKGFTLVELIVVIAIIGVLAAILVPTMLGYVTSSRVTSANSTASSIKNQVDAFLTTADTAGYGMKLADTAMATLSIDVTAAADGSSIWTVTLADGSFAADSAFKSKTGVGSWETSGKADKDTTKTGTNATQILAVELRNLFPDIKGGAIKVFLQGGKAKYCWYTADATAVKDVSSNAPTADDFAKEKFAWDGSTAGVTSDGYILGTAPALAIGGESK